MEVNDQLHVLAAWSPGKEHGREESVGPRAVLDVWEEGKFFAPIGIQTPHLPARRLVTILHQW